MIDRESVERLIVKLQSQIGDDVQQVYDHGALFRLSIETFRALLDEKEKAIQWAKDQHAAADKYAARVEAAEARLAEANEKLAALYVRMSQVAGAGLVLQEIAKRGSLPLEDGEEGTFRSARDIVEETE